jgi:CheY-like chemotaxis protein
MRIVVIDDDAVVRTLVRAVLTREGYDVTVTQDGVEGLRAAADVQPDLVLVDSTMPGMTGADVLEALAADTATAAIPVVVMSADWTSVNGGLRKPFSPTELVDLVRDRLSA